MKMGMNDAAIRRRLAKGSLHRVHPGVYAVGYPSLTAEGRWMAAVLACGRGAVLSHLDAAVLWSIYKSQGARVHVTVLSRRAVPGLWIHRARHLDPDDVTTKDGIPVTTVARTLVDLTDLLAEDRVLRAIREAEYLKLLDPQTLTAAVKRAHGRRRIAALKNALAHHRPGQIVREELEHRFLELVRQAGLPPPETNVKVRTHRRTYTVDCLWPEHQVAVELDGRAAHARTAAFEEDRARDAALCAIGLRPLRFTWHRVSSDGAYVIAELDATLRQAAAPARPAMTSSHAGAVSAAGRSAA
jgi:very-short-patch-repair endonuclease